MLAGSLGLVSAEPGLFLPLLAVQLLWINLVTDGPPALALGIDPKEDGIMRRHPRRSGSGVLHGSDWIRLAGIGLLMMLATLWVLDAYYPGGLFTLPGLSEDATADRETHARTMAFTTLMMLQLVNVFCSRSPLRSAFSDIFANPWLIGAVTISLALHLAVIYIPSLQVAFQTVPLSSIDWLVAVAVAATLLVATEAAKAGARFALARRRAPPDQVP
jgi:Ca2+-transporting ATPase